MNLFFPGIVKIKLKDQKKNIVGCFPLGNMYPEVAKLGTV